MRRRTFLASTLLSLTAPEALVAQVPARGFRLGWVVASSSTSTAPFLEALRAGLADLGYHDGRNYVLEARYADDVLGRVPALAEELLRMPVDIIVTQGPATRVVATAKTTIPVVYVFSADPVEAGFAQSLSHPGGNATGITLLSVELNGKRLELLREVLPAVRRAAVIANPDHRGEQQERRETEETAQRLGIAIQYLSVQNEPALEASFAAIAAGAPEAIVVFPDPLTIRNRQRIADFAMTRRIPVISAWSVFARSGALFSYGPRLTEPYRRAAYYVDRILKGTSPADLPIERPTVFELLVNMRTAAALGIAIPPAFLARADEVIE